MKIKIKLNKPNYKKWWYKYPLLRVMRGDLIQFLQEIGMSKIIEIQYPWQNKVGCSHKDDMFARTDEGQGYFQCQTHLRDSIYCNRDLSNPNLN